MEMKMVIVICPESREQEVSNLIAKHDVKSFSLIKDITGSGRMGKRLDTPVWPGKSILIFTVVDDSKSNELKETLKECAHNLYPGEGMRAFVLPIEDMI
jgi:nitrogen regulatory protein PII